MKIIGFGDYLMHFSPFGNERFMQAESMRLSFTGAEANVCAALSLWGEDVCFVTRLPDNALAEKGLSMESVCVDRVCSFIWVNALVLVRAKYLQLNTEMFYTVQSNSLEEIIMM